MPCNLYKAGMKVVVRDPRRGASPKKLPARNSVATVVWGYTPPAVKGINDRIPLQYTYYDGDVVTNSFPPEDLFPNMLPSNAQEVEVDGDGNCQFRALADQVCGSESCHEKVRKGACKQLQDHQDEYDWAGAKALNGVLIVSDWNVADYTAIMACPCRGAGDPQWGDQMTLQVSC